MENSEEPILTNQLIDTNIAEPKILQNAKTIKRSVIYEKKLKNFFIMMEISKIVYMMFPNESLDNIDLYKRVVRGIGTKVVKGSGKGRTGKATKDFTQGKYYDLQLIGYSLNINQVIDRLVHMTALAKVSRKKFVTLTEVLVEIRQGYLDLTSLIKGAAQNYELEMKSKPKEFFTTTNIEI